MSPSMQRTIQSPIHIQGIGLHSGLRVNLHIKPAESNTGILFKRIDVDNNNQVAMKYGIRSIPTLLLFKDGEVVDQVIGNVGKESIESMLNKAL